MPKALVNGEEIEFDPGMTVLQVCELAGEEIPRFCYHERLEIAGNCRMCLVEIKGGPPKPAASCAMPAGEGMDIWTNTPMVKKAREGVMEFLLINHPLDCPICDQGGECDLQDQAMFYGRGENRYDENKRAVKDKYMGPLIKTHMTRCIHCTRCVRFMDDVAGVAQLGATGRGENMEVGTFIEQGLTSELSGNIIDLCPVGALTSKPYAFKARSWELTKTYSVDVLDAVGSNIRVDSRGNEVMRILPGLNEDVNEEWISDKVRFSYDGLKAQRLDRPYLRKKGKLQPVSWDEAMAEVVRRLKKADPKKIGGIVGDQADAESMFLLKALFDGLKSPNLDCRQDGMVLDGKVRAHHLFNTTIGGIEEADALLIIGANPRKEAAVLNARIRKRSLKGNFPVAVIGEAADLTYPAKNLGQSLKILEEFTAGKHEFAKLLKKAKNPMVILGSAALNRTDSLAILAKVVTLCEKLGVVGKGWNGFNVLHHAASRVAGLELGLVPGRGGKDVAQMLKLSEGGDMDVMFLLGADEVPVDRMKKAFVIYQGSHGDVGAANADVILPGAAYTEKYGTYLNTEGRLQRTRRAVFPPGEAKDDVEILLLLLTQLEIHSGVANLSDIRERLGAISSAFSVQGEIAKAIWQPYDGKVGAVKEGAVGSFVANFYQTCPITRASRTMARCVDELVDGNRHLQEKEAA